MSKFNFDKLNKNFNQLKTDLPEIIATEGQKYFFNSFRQQGFEGNKWKEVQRRIAGTNAYKYPKKKKLGRRSKPILSGFTGRLRRAVADSKREARFERIRWEVDVPYAIYHNDGTDKIPQRKFMDLTPKLLSKFRGIIDKKIKQVFK